MTETLSGFFDPDLENERPLILLDLDETLIATFWENRERNKENRDDRISSEQFKHLQMQCGFHALAVPERIDQQYCTIEVDKDIFCIVCLRPGVREFLRLLYQNYDFAIWSAGGSMYVQAVCDFLFAETDREHYKYPKPAFIWSKPMCPDELPHSPHHKLQYTKPIHLVLQHYPVQISKVVLLDNRKENGVYYPLNLVNIVTWRPDNLKQLEDPVYRKQQEQYLWYTCMSEIQMCIHRLHQIYHSLPHFPIVQLPKISINDEIQELLHSCETGAYHEE